MLGVASRDTQRTAQQTGGNPRPRPLRSVAKSGVRNRQGAPDRRRSERPRHVHPGPPGPRGGEVPSGSANDAALPWAGSRVPRRAGHQPGAAPVPMPGSSRRHHCGQRRPRAASERRAAWTYRALVGQARGMGDCPISGPVRATCQRVIRQTPTAQEGGTCGQADRP